MRWKPLSQRQTQTRQLRSQKRRQCATEGVDGFSDDIDYLSIMKQSCLNGDYEAGVVAEKARNKKIDVLGLNVTKVFFEDLLELSKIITAECGDKRCL